MASNDYFDKVKTVTKEQIIQKIIQNESVLRELGIKRIALFGSYSRNEQTSDSDVDFIWDLQKPRTLNSIGKAQQALNKLFPNINVDTVFESAINKYFKTSITESMIEILK